MKYIRTKYGIHYNSELKRVLYKPSEIIKQADAIKELCDEFVLKDIDSEFCGILPKDELIKYNKINMGQAYHREFYGAIWTKGENGEPILKSVAKMNDEGKLKLL